MNNNNNNYEQFTKRAFVKTYLEPLIKRIDTDILTCEYVKATPSNEEYVNVWFNSRFPNGTPYRRQICVTANSIAYIAIDVIKAII